MRNLLLRELAIKELAENLLLTARLNCRRVLWLPTFLGSLVDKIASA